MGAPEKSSTPAGLQLHYFFRRRVEKAYIVPGKEGPRGGA